jgi:hypothetical protein
LLKLNVKREDGTGARLGMFLLQAYVSISCVLFSVMRKDAVYTVILNVTLFGGMRCSLAQDPRYLRVSAIENGVTTTYNIKVFFNLFTLCFMLTVIDMRSRMLELREILWKESTPIFPYDKNLKNSLDGQQ